MKKIPTLFKRVFDGLILDCLGEKMRLCLRYVFVKVILFGLKTLSGILNICDCLNKRALRFFKE